MLMKLRKLALLLLQLMLDMIRELRTLEMPVRLMMKLLQIIPFHLMMGILQLMLVQLPLGMKLIQLFIGIPVMLSILILVRLMPGIHMVLFS
uniref:Uncharacterized protein n=1 Tax=Picea glauca TaxID=3330 RepID=A0A101M2A1_PICGL|nr:hypothetical protein ABT39_MTgene2901 [Picea glauca]QHR87566.1 hypothetical protein Q903MT_gene1577 [Picea sitchensis]